jgi:hypothetical protein
MPRTQIEGRTMEPPSRPQLGEATLQASDIHASVTLHIGTLMEPHSNSLTVTHANSEWFSDANAD